MGFKPSYCYKWTEAQKYEKSKVMYDCVRSHDICLAFLLLCSCIYAKPFLSGDDLYCILCCLYNFVLSYFW